MTNDSQMFADRFNPLSKGPTDPELRLAFEQSQVRSVVDSYHGRIDVFAEAIQNSVDALETRWSEWDGTTDPEEAIDNKPRLRVVINLQQNTLEVIDNGVGIAPDKLEDLLEPFVTDKRFSSMPTRGHKGVGTTFLAYGHPRFEIHTKTATMQDAVGYYIAGGRSWAMSSTLGGPPDYIKVATPHPSLAAFSSGTYVKVNFDESTTLKSISAIRHNTPLMWLMVLRSTTAIGSVDLGIKSRELPGWKRNISITVEHQDGTLNAAYKFPFPHESSGENARELQALQNAPSTKREYELIYVERSHEDLARLLSAELEELENSQHEDAAPILNAFNDFEVSIYASLAYKNTFYEEQFAELIQKPSAERFSLTPGVGGGVMVASVSMPMGTLQPHLSPTMQPQERRRYFLLVHFNSKYSPDIGRKTIPQAVEALVSWLEYELLKLLRTQAQRLYKDKESSTRPHGATLATATEELKALAIQIDKFDDFEDDIDFNGLILQRSPHWEAEVTALFLSLMADGIIPGYSVRAIPGASSRYDILFNYELRPGDQDATPQGLRVSPQQIDPYLKLSNRWLEVKVDINDFIANLDEEAGSPSKKYFNHVDLLVVWSISPISSEKYAVEAITSGNWKDRILVGSTHFLTAGDNDHRIEVICLKEVLTIAFGGSL